MNMKTIFNAKRLMGYGLALGGLLTVTAPVVSRAQKTLKAARILDNVDTGSVFASSNPDS